MTSSESRFYSWPPRYVERVRSVSASVSGVFIKSSWPQVKPIRVPVAVLASTSVFLGRLLRAVDDVERVAIVVEDALQDDLTAFRDFATSGCFALDDVSRPRIFEVFGRLGVDLHQLDLTQEEGSGNLKEEFQFDDVQFEAELQEEDEPIQFESDDFDVMPVETAAEAADEDYYYDDDYEEEEEEEEDVKPTFPLPSRSPRKKATRSRKSRAVEEEMDDFIDDDDVDDEDEDYKPLKRSGIRAKDVKGYKKAYRNSLVTPVFGKAKKDRGQSAAQIYTEGVQDETKKHLCPDCIFSTNDKSTFKQHRIFHIRGGSKSDEKLYFCPYCLKDFKTKYQKDEHTRSEHNETYLRCRYCRKAFYLTKKTEFEAHEAEHEIPKYKNCIQCGLEFPKGKPQAVQHLKVHGERHDGQCVQCPAVFNSWEEHKEHVKAAHSAIWHYRCGHCGEIFDRKDLMREHRFSMHGEENKRTLCPECGKNIGKQYMAYHMSTHTGEDLIQCPHCPMMVKKMRFKTHIKDSHNPQVCTECGKQFAGITALRRHRRSQHIPDEEKAYHCRYCRKGFNTKQFWLDHENIHTGERPHKCDTCGNTYKNTSALVQHIRTVHKGLKRTHKEEQLSQAAKKRQLQIQ